MPNSGEPEDPFGSEHPSTGENIQPAGTPGDQPAALVVGADFLPNLKITDFDAVIGDPIRGGGDGPRLQVKTQFDVFLEKLGLTAESTFDPGDALDGRFGDAAAPDPETCSCCSRTSHPSMFRRP